MNYRHAFHAGNFADVFKHAVLALVLDHLRAKEKPFRVMDTHAGAGRYDLEGTEASRTGEARHGIQALIGTPGNGPPLLPALRPYLDALKRLDAGRRFYPGSPLLAHALLRPQDKLQLAELHAQEAAALERLFAGDTRVSIEAGDGFRRLRGWLPPRERRGVVLIDPPYEAKDEAVRAASGLRHALNRWPTGIFLLWYPVKDRASADALVEAMAPMAASRLLRAELLVWPDQMGHRLNGSGLLIANPPWRLAEDIDALLPALHARLRRTDCPPGFCRWLRHDEAVRDDIPPGEA